MYKYLSNFEVTYVSEGQYHMTKIPASCIIDEDCEKSDAWITRSIKEFLKDSSVSNPVVINWWYNN